MISQEPKQYKSGEICQMFDIVKNTLYDWERKGKIPPAKRDWRKHRYYTQEHIDAIKMFIGGFEAMRKEFEGICSTETPETREALKRQFQLLSVSKISRGLAIGFQELAQCDNLAAETIRALLQDAHRRDPNTTGFKRTIQLIYSKTVLMDQVSSGSITPSRQPR